MAKMAFLELPHVLKTDFTQNLIDKKIKKFPNHGLPNTKD